jgi:hypothetical protein
MSPTIRILLPVAIAITLSSSAMGTDGPVTFPDACDASAAAALGPDRFVMANDEDNRLRIYNRSGLGGPERIELKGFLDADGEADIEGVTTIGRRLYWITSHGRNKNGKERPGRHRFFATDLVGEGAASKVVPVGSPYTGLLQAFQAAPHLSKYRLADAARLAPEAEGGLNVEGLAAMPDGRMLVGLRNPVRDGKALLVTIENPDEVVAGQAARIGPAYELKMGGRGIRSIEYSASRREYLIVAGPTGDEGSFELRRWSGPGSDEPSVVPNVAFDGLNPEALFFFPGDDQRVHFLSDDGGVLLGGLPCKDAPAQERRFRSFSRVVP